jgi:hypothetical protein
MKLKTVTVNHKFANRECRKESKELWDLVKTECKLLTLWRFRWLPLRLMR